MCADICRCDTIEEWARWATCDDASLHKEPNFEIRDQRRDLTLARRNEHQGHANAFVVDARAMLKVPMHAEAFTVIACKQCARHQLQQTESVPKKTKSVLFMKPGICSMRFHAFSKLKSTNDTVLTYALCTEQTIKATGSNE